MKIVKITERDRIEDMYSEDLIKDYYDFVESERGDKRKGLVRMKFYQDDEHTILFGVADIYFDNEDTDQGNIIYIRKIVERERDTCPEIVKKITDFINIWSNPDRLPNGPRPIKEYQLAVFDISYDFYFKWVIEKDEFLAVVDYVGEIVQDDQNTIKLQLGEYQIELEYIQS